MIGQEEFKLVQYADDLTLFVPNIECAELILQLLDRFTICSGLKVNHTKTEAMWIHRPSQKRERTGKEYGCFRLFEKLRYSYERSTIF